MIEAALLVFREALEAALVITIVLAATRGVAQRGLWVSGGAAAGVAGAVVVALCAGLISEALGGVGQEVFNAAILIAAVLMLAWHAIWMAHHGRELAMQMKREGNAVATGARPPTALLLVVALAVLREGSEVVLFLFGISAGGVSPWSMGFGSALGLAAGALIGVLLYFGLLRIPMRHFFNATNWMILLLAAGMASQSARFLIQADVLPDLGAHWWDTSAILSNQSPLGGTLKTLVGYDATPAGMQVVFYLATALSILTGMKLWGTPRTPALVAAK